MQYEKLVTVGTGTFGRVYLVRHVETGKYYAMKTLRKTQLIEYKQVDHVNSERLILSTTQHPFIVNLFHTFQDDKYLYMVMEFVMGGELFFHLRKQCRFSNTTARFYAAEIILALEHLHSFHIIYRDLKPENLLVDHEGHIKITDFGFAKRVEDRTWTVCGTPEYMAPEIVMSRGHGKAADWWSVGVLIYEMLAGYPPFYDENPFGIYEKILRGSLEFPPHFDKNAIDLIQKLLTRDPMRRLGNLRNGAKDIKEHKWFEGLDWEAIANKQVTPPYIPEIKHEGDTSLFEKYDEISDTHESVHDAHFELFKDFPVCDKDNIKSAPKERRSKKSSSKKALCSFLEKLGINEHRLST